MDSLVHRGDDRPASLYELDRPSLESFVADLGHPRYRADQLWHWLYRRGAQSFDEMHNLPAGLRRELHESTELRTIRLVTVTTSRDGQADKYLFRLTDGQLVETVLMHYEDPADGESPPGVDRGMVPAKPPHSGGQDHGNADDERTSGFTGVDRSGAPPPSQLAIGGGGRHTVCLSTQAGCAMGCSFCATGQMGLVRDLTPGEIVQQAVFCARQLRDQGQRLTNAVFMGMGEPLANVSATWQAIETLTDADGFGLGARRITVSTVGIVPGIDRLAAMGKPVRLAVSLHAADDTLRSSLVAINDTYPLDDILSACRRYQAAVGRRITFEVVLIEGVNDQSSHAVAIAHRLAGLEAHVNLIPLNPTAGSTMSPSPPQAVLRFKRVLESLGVTTSARLRRGIDIDAGCGQLRTRAATGLVGRTVRPPDVGPLKEHETT